MTFNLMVQIAPLLASMDCILKILKLIKPLIDVVKSPARRRIRQAAEGDH